ncbi:MAG: hypothetical protein WBV23_11825 [Desulfobaccales bacterium]
MDKRCSICTHSALAEIDQALRAGVSLRSLAAQYGLSLSALSRHTKHLRRALANAADEVHQAHQAALLDKLDLFDVRLDRIFRKSEELNSLHVSLGCIQEGLRIFALREKIRQSREGQL